MVSCSICFSCGMPQSILQTLKRVMDDMTKAQSRGTLQATTGRSREKRPTSDHVCIHLQCIAAHYRSPMPTSNPGKLDGRAKKKSVPAPMLSYFACPSWLGPSSSVLPFRCRLRPSLSWRCHPSGRFDGEAHGSRAVQSADGFMTKRLQLVPPRRLAA